MKKFTFFLLFIAITTFSLYVGALTSKNTHFISQRKSDSLRQFPDTVILHEIRFRRLNLNGFKYKELANYVSDTLIHELIVRKRKRGIGGHADERNDLYRMKKYIPDSYDLFTKVAKSVPALIPKKYINKNSNGSYSFKKNINLYWKAYAFCDANVRFGLQPSCAIGTGFIIKDNLIATAGHCFEGKKSTDFYVVFGYQMLNEDDYNRNLKKEDVYEIESVDLMKSMKDKIDFALIKVKGKLSLDKKALVPRTSPISPKEELYTLGYPQGIPLKYANNGRLFSSKPSSDKNIFKIKLDLFEGNSGSPILDKQGNVLGMVLAGDVDTDIFIENDCPYLYNCDLNGHGSCIGESIQYISVIHK
ncbi:S1 family peptidase [Runella salmonicolor]|uniref:Serine protease n=1 Tax=Runella salmonicolor TaxID=2950278 RepID=A0ABT1FJJ5_9BACT|nr:serine protease [Runella salmonicolor]MCP1381904.1 serine protease [Runella salmonicolor]